MNRADDNTTFVLAKIISEFRIKISEQTVRNYLHAHPQFPTLKSVCDALKKWKVDHYPLKLELNEIEELKLPFIAHLKEGGGQIAFVKEIADRKVSYAIQRGKLRVVDFDEFAKKISGAVILIEPDQKVSEPEYRINSQNQFLERILLPLSVAAVLLTLTYGFASNFSGGFQREPIFLGLIALILLGITASVFLVLKELKVHTAVTDKLCGFSSKTDCDAVLSSDASKFFGLLNWADVGLVYFIGSLIFLSGSGSMQALTYFALVSILALPYPVFSVYYQGFRLKKWCPFCLLAQAALVGIAVLILPVFQEMAFSVFDFLRLAASFVFPAVVWILYRFLGDKIHWGELQYRSFADLKRNPELFTALLVRNGRVEFQEFESDLILGNPKAPVTITAFLSLYCNPCASAFQKMKDLVESCPDVRINAIFSVYDDEETQKLVNALYHNYKTKGYADTLQFLHDWYSLPQQSRKALYENQMIPESYNVVAEVAAKNQAFFLQYEVKGTPTVYLNGYEFPKQYDYAVIEYFTDEIKYKTLESKRQEAIVKSK